MASSHRFKAIVITGASTGIGNAAAIALAHHGYHVLAGVRRQEDADALRGYQLDQLEPIILDVTVPKHLENAASIVASATRSSGLYALINNAGIASGGPQESIELDDWRRVMEVNVFGTVATTRVMLPFLRMETGARIINVSSAYGCVPVPFLAPYCASKHALEALSGGLRTELRPWGIHVSIIAPTDVRTPIWDKAEVDVAKVIERLSEPDRLRYEATLRRMAQHAIAAGHRGLPVEQVTRVIVRAVNARRPKARYSVGMNSHLLAIARRILPAGMLDALIRWQAGLSLNRAIVEAEAGMS